MTALSRPVSAGGGKAGKPADVPPATKDAAAKEQFNAATGMDATPSTPDPFTFLGTGRGSTKPSLDARVRKYRRNKERAKDSMLRERRFYPIVYGA